MFEVGQEVAVISWGGFGPRRITRAKVAKAGKRDVYIETNGHQWDTRFAQKDGRAAEAYTKKCLELWGAKHDEEVAREKDLNERQAKLHEVQKLVGALRKQDLTHEQLDAILNIIK